MSYLRKIEKIECKAKFENLKWEPLDTDAKVLTLVKKLLPGKGPFEYAEFTTSGPLSEGSNLWETKFHGSKSVGIEGTGSALKQIEVDGVKYLLVKDSYTRAGIGTYETFSLIRRGDAK